MKFKIALIQTEILFGEREKNLRKLERMIREAAGAGAGFICLPESCNIGYRDSRIRQMAEEMSETEDGVTLTKMKALARELGIYLIVPLLLKTEEGCRNTAVLLGDRGEQIGSYAKTHLTASEQKYLTPGSEYPVFETKYGKVGIMICNDVGWPEVGRILALKGSELVFLPAAWAYFEDVPFWWKVIVRARAMENAFVMAAVNHTGQAWDDGTPFCGNSALIDPSGAIRGEMAEEEDGILLRELDREDIEDLRRTYGYMLEGRKPREYTILCEPVIHIQK